MKLFSQKQENSTWCKSNEQAELGVTATKPIIMNNLSPDLSFNNDKAKKTLSSLFMDGVQLPQDYSHFEEAVYFLPFSSQKFLVLILSTSEGWKTESTLEPPSSFEHGTPGLGI